MFIYWFKPLQLIECTVDTVAYNQIKIHEFIDLLQPWLPTYRQATAVSLLGRA